jgi:hypothetical protein
MNAQHFLLDGGMKMTLRLWSYFTAKMSLLELSKDMRQFPSPYKSDNICDALNTGLNERALRRETNEQKRIFSNRRNCGGSSGTVNPILHDARQSSASYHQLES